jgi:diaminopimelate epimerase
MRMFNADGSEAEMCGNGIRCLAKYVVEEGLSDADPLRVQTGAGVLALRCEREESGRVWSVAVDMGPPTLETRLLPVEIAMLGQAGEGQYAVETLAGRFEGMFVSMGNPHFVSFLPDAEAMKQIDLAAAGPQLERHPAFPERMNVHFVRVLGREEATMLTWERGSGVTLACGTGACAVLVAGVRLGLLDRRALIHLPGGDLVISWPDDDATVSMIGPAQRICDGVWHG